MTRQPSEVITGQHAIYRTMDADLAEVKRKGLGVIRYVVALYPEDEWYLQDREDARLCLDVLAAHYGRCCLLCGTGQELLVDHIIPLRRKGTSDIENLQILCRTCNFRKGIQIIDYRPFPFSRELEFCRACQKHQVAPFTMIYWMGEHVGVCAKCLPDYEGTLAVIEPQLHSETPWLGCIS